jgi:hypothetical protein
VKLITCIQHFHINNLRKKDINVLIPRKQNAEHNALATTSMFIIEQQHG